MRFNKFQEAIARTYGGGDFAYLIEPDATRAELDRCGDTLFRFLMIELGDEGEWKMDSKTAEQRMNSAIRDCELALAAVQKVQP